MLLGTFKIVSVTRACAPGVLKVVMVTGFFRLYSRQGLTRDRADGARFPSVKQRRCSALARRKCARALGRHCNTAPCPVVLLEVEDLCRGEKKKRKEKERRSLIALRVQCSLLCPASSEGQRWVKNHFHKERANIFKLYISHWLWGKIHTNKNDFKKLRGELSWKFSLKDEL